jgi:hypothetical protein
MIRHPLLFAVVVVGATSACALKPPVQSSGPSVSREGITVAVLGQRCEQVSEPDLTDDLAEVTLLVRVHNPTRDIATVRRTDFRLIGDERFALKTRTWGAAEPITIQPGSDDTFDLRFMARGAVECGKEIRLDPGTAIVTGNRPVKIPVVTFTSRRA